MSSGLKVETTTVSYFLINKSMFKKSEKYGWYRLMKMFVKIKKTLAILLMVLFVISVTAAAASAAESGKIVTIAGAAAESGKTVAIAGATSGLNSQDNEC